MNETSKLRPVKPLKITDLLPASLGDDTDRPALEWVDPSSLYIEERYQRGISERSVTLIRRIYKDFDWARFKPPVCAYGQGDKLMVLDGQHTAIAAASHPKLTKIPVMIVSAATVKARAEAFMGHNRDRLAITLPQLFYSSLAAEEPVALALKKALDEVGCTVVKFNPPVYSIGQTRAVGALLTLTERKGTAGAERVLKILFNAKRAPIGAVEVSAVADLLWGKEWEGRFDDYDLTTVIRSKTPDQWRADAEAKVRKGQTMPMKRALAITWFKVLPKKRKGDNSKIKIKTL